MERTEVLVQGAGPVGLYAAVCLARRGVGVRIIDRHHRAALHSYALCLHSRTLRFFDEIGIAQRLIDHGQRVDRVAIHRGRQTLSVVELDRVGGEFPHALVIPQTAVEAALEGALEDAGIRVEWGRQGLSFDAGVDGVTTLVGDVSDTENVPSFPIESELLIGADGYDSLVRRLLGLEFDDVGPVLRYGLIEFRTELDAPEEIAIVLGDRSTDVMWPLGSDRVRWGVRLDEEGAADARSLEACIRRRAPWFRGEFGAVDWLDSVEFQPRLARRFGDGRVWMAGDSARMTSPIGVQAMNVGLFEARDLARRIANILRRGASPKLLRYYSEDRTRGWKALLGIKKRLHALPDVMDWVGDSGQLLSQSLPASGRDLNALLEQIGLKLDWTRRRKLEPGATQSD